jgi:Tfp pilus assembly protein PilN
MLDQISRALPPMVWLTELKQSPDPNEVVITGRCTNLTALTDFAANLEASGYYNKSVQIVNIQKEIAPPPAVKLITFTLTAQYQRPGEAVPQPGVSEPIRPST